MPHQHPYHGHERRHIPKSQDGFYRFIVAVNVLAWVIFVISLVVFHYARPELISGVQEFWGIEGRTDWAESLTFYLIVLLAVCTCLGIVTMVMRRQRSRRKNDFFGINLMLLLAVSSASLGWILYEVST